MCTNNGSVWYRFTPSSDTVVDANTVGSGYDTVLSVYTGSPGALEQMPGACNDDFNGGQSRVVFSATANTTYFLLVGFCCGNGGTGGGNLVLSIAGLEAPGNDDFANAAEIPALPFSDTVDTSAATVQTGEPTSSCGGARGTVWYAFTPTETGSITASTAGYYPTVAAYTGSSLANLREVGCGAYWGRLTFRASAGQTYYFQVGSSPYGRPGTLKFDLDLAPALNSNFVFYPSDPSPYDTVQFYAQSYDPGDAVIASRAWEFGDGATSTETYPAHRHAADGDYTVQLVATTSDGRTASTTQTVRVRTHDVAITKIAAPESASARQTRQISVEIRNNRQPETVSVELFKSTPGGFQHVGSLTQSVPVRPSNRTTSFTFNYTFTDEDAAVGKVTFKAVATLEGAHDALPADNEAISSPTKVNR